MKNVNLSIGSLCTTSSGVAQDDTTPVTFEADELAQLQVYGSHNRQPTDTRGTTQTLYRTPDGRLVVHVETWSRWIGEPTDAHLEIISEQDLAPLGRFYALGREAGLSRSMTLDEALKAA